MNEIVAKSNLHTVRVRSPAYTYAYVYNCTCTLSCTRAPKGSENGLPVFFSRRNCMDLVSKIANGCCAKFQVNLSCGGAWESADVRGRV